MYLFSENKENSQQGKKKTCPLAVFYGKPFFANLYYRLRMLQEYHSNDLLS
jgi:hypothetical protein